MWYGFRDYVGRVLETMESFVIVHNVAKRHNIGTLARSATAFGVSEFIVVGRKDFNAFGSHGSTLHINFRHFHTLQEAQQYLKGKDCDICGVEIADGALAVHEHPFRKSTAFLLGNEGTGLSTKEMEICDFFVYISQYGCGTASLNVTIAGSIVLHHFAALINDPEQSRIAYPAPESLICQIRSDVLHTQIDPNKSLECKFGQLSKDDVVANFDQIFTRFSRCPSKNVILHIVMKGFAFDSLLKFDLKILRIVCFDPVAGRAHEVDSKRMRELQGTVKSGIERQTCEEACIFFLDHEVASIVLNSNEEDLNVYKWIINELMIQIDQGSYGRHFRDVHINFQDFLDSLTALVTSSPKMCHEYWKNAAGKLSRPGALSRAIEKTTLRTSST
ncbi:hypothetical protein KI387_028580, partial [Taxus chinensis]